MRYIHWISLVVLSVLITAGAIFAQTSAFTYQGRLTDNNAPANGIYDMQFSLFDTVSGGNQIGSPVNMPGVTVTDGVFSVNLDFGASSFLGADRYLQIAVRLAGSQNPHTFLNPRERITSAPYAIRSLNSSNADTALNSENLGGVAANQFVQTTDFRLSNERPPTAGNGNYIQNTTSQQSSANFNINGTGTANILNAATQFNIGGNRVLSIEGTENVFAGVGAGSENTTGDSNSFFGNSAGSANTTGRSNSFFGAVAGRSNTTGTQNSFFGGGAGVRNTTGNSNAFFGIVAGNNNFTGSGNAFFGTAAGGDQRTGDGNTFIGLSAGSLGLFSTTGSFNTFVGQYAGASNTTGSNNTAIGSGAGVGGNLTFATAIGSNAVVSTSNTIVLGRANGSDTVQVPGFLQVSTLGILGNTSLCRNASFEISTCSSSVRYKQNINPFKSGLDLIKLLRPVSFNWRSDNSLDFGLVAEEAATAEPLLVTYNTKGEVEGVKYDRLGVVLINAVKEQQLQIKTQEQKIKQQQEQIQRQQLQIDALIKLVCSTNSQAEICKEKEQ